VDKSLPIIKEKWSGPIGVYPDADRHDYVQARSDPNFENRTSPDDFLKHARGWVDGGVQVIGGCCGFGLDYIKPLREGLPSHIPTSGT
jgi:S-methylmethionine-dependent homocysteine/selenocysteine methylase